MSWLFPRFGTHSLSTFTRVILRLLHWVSLIRLFTFTGLWSTKKFFDMVYSTAREHPSIICHLCSFDLLLALCGTVTFLGNTVVSTSVKAFGAAAMPPGSIIDLDGLRRHQIVLLYHAFSMQPGHQNNQSTHKPLPPSSTLIKYSKIPSSIITTTMSTAAPDQ